MIRRLGTAAAVVSTVLAFYVIAPSPGTVESERLGIFERNRNVANANATYYAIGDTLRAVNGALLRTRAWEMARAIAPDPAPTKVITLPGLVPQTAQIFADAARSELAALGTPRVPIRVLLQPDAQLAGQYRKQTVMPQTADQPCVVVVTISQRAQNLFVVADDRLLGVCGFYAKFGRPGSGMQAWLENTRGVSASIDTVLREPRERNPRNKLAGGAIGLMAADAACLAGNDEGCAQSVLDPYGLQQVRHIVPSTEQTVAVLMSFSTSGRYRPGNTLAAIRAHVGDPVFQAIWSSAELPAAAFQTATGEHIAAFARPILLRQSLPHSPGPLRGGLPLFLGLSIGATAAAWAISRTRRERSGS